MSLSDDLADDLGDVDFEDPGNAGDDEGWETEDEMEAEAEQDDSDLTFSKHSGSGTPSWIKTSSQSRLQSKYVIFLLRFCPGSVFCVSLDPATNSLAVTGGEDDKAFVWRVTDGEVLLECTGEGQTQHKPL